MYQGLLVKFPLLALLAAAPAHGYELKQQFDARFSPFWPPVNIGQVYTTLQRLERDGLVRESCVDDSSRPPRHVFEITADGRAAVRAWIESTNGGFRLRDDFFVRLTLAQTAGLADPLALLEAQRHAALQELRDLNDLLLRPENQDPATRLLIEGATLHLEADLKWIDLCETQVMNGGF